MYERALHYGDRVPRRETWQALATSEDLLQHYDSFQLAI